MTKTIGWELYRSFLGVLETGTLSGAARSLGMTQPTIGRHVAALEKALGLALSTRSQAGLLATNVALELQPYAESMRSNVAALERTASSQGAGANGTVRITASEVIGVEVLPTIVRRLRERHPDLKIELVLTDRVQDLFQREADIAVRMVRPTQEALIARRIGHIAVGLHANREYLAGHKRPRTAADLAAHDLIGFDVESAFVRSVLGSLKGYDRAAFAIRTDHDLAYLALIRAGAGIGFCQVSLARRDPEMVRLLAETFTLQLDTWITMHEDLRNSVLCRVAFDALVEGLRQHVG